MSYQLISNILPVQEGIQLLQIYFLFDDNTEQRNNTTHTCFLKKERSIMFLGVICIYLSDIYDDAHSLRIIRGTASFYSKT